MPQSKGDLDGGPGTTLAVLLAFDRQAVASARDDLRWHQTRLASHFMSRIHLNAMALASADAFAATAAALARRLAGATTLPVDLATAARVARDASDWPGECLVRLDAAVRAGDLAAARRWSRELAGASFQLADLHRWLGFLADNALACLRFQAQCAEAFEACDQAGGRYLPLSSPSNLPAGMLTLHGVENFLEIERQAEEIFAAPAGRGPELESDPHLSATSMLVRPERRAAYLAIESALGPEGGATLARATETPFDASFLHNVLYRAEAAGMLDAYKTVVRRAEQRGPVTSVERLMEVLVYRGHSFAGIEWSDRFAATLLDDAAALASVDDAVAFAAAGRIAHEAFGRRGEYSVTLTLRDAIERGTFDCVRATDLVLTLFRDGGHAGAGHVRWSAGTAGHAVAARWDLARAADGGAAQVFTLDPLATEITEAAWPENCSRGCRWPPLLADNPQPYAAELFVRGIDSYVWAAGYVVRGAQAARFDRAPVPYLRGFTVGR